MLWWTEGAIMDFETAVRILKERTAPSWMQEEAARVYMKAYRQPEESPTMTHDDYEDTERVRGETVHIHLHHPSFDAAPEDDPSTRETMRRSNGSVTPMGDDPDPLAVGAELIMELSGKGTDYFISAMPDGGTGLYRHATANGAGGDMGKQPAGGKTMDFLKTQKRMQPRYDQQRTTLKSWNERNAEFWNKQKAG
jgi:hypothetical protein